MPRKPAPKPDDAEQSKRFIETAKELEAGDAGVLERAFKKISRAEPKGRQKQTDQAAGDSTEEEKD